MTDAFQNSLVRKIVALQCKEVGFDNINGDALEELTKLYMQCKGFAIVDLVNI
jgi:hypothetical protein